MTDNTKGIGMGFEDPAPPYTTNPQPQFIYPQNGQQVPQQISTVFNAQASTPQSKLIMSNFSHLVIKSYA
jgi:hypothetical protein